MRTKSNNDDDEVVPPAVDADGTVSTPAHASSHADGTVRIVSAAPSTSTSTSTSVWSKTNMGPLFQLVRPANFPGIVLFHMMGVYLALLGSIGTISKGAVNMNWTLYWNILLKEPTMWLVLAALLLTSSTSMVVNDYYDAKLGRDDVGVVTNVNGDINGVVNQMINNHPLAQGRVSLPTARRFLSYLYGAALVTLACLPGVHVRLSVVLGLILTYFYTQSLKPVTWVKNVVCASLIALSPLTSGMAALTVMQQHANQQAVVGGDANTMLAWTATGMILPRLWRLTATLFFGILGREIMMDCNDVENDGRANVRTVPVVHGRRFASAIAFGTTVIMAGLTVGLELLEIVTTTRTGTFLDSIPRQAARRLALAGIASALTLRRSWQVYRTQGSDSKAVDKAVDESLVTVAILLASFV
jgi:4-hydroxybenzoate polyprenyltransferase